MFFELIFILISFNKCKWIFTRFFTLQSEKSYVDVFEHHVRTHNFPISLNESDDDSSSAK